MACLRTPASRVVARAVVTIFDQHAALEPGWLTDFLLDWSTDEDGLRRERNRLVAEALPRAVELFSTMASQHAAGTTITAGAKTDAKAAESRVRASWFRFSLLLKLQGTYVRAVCVGEENAGEGYTGVGEDDRCLAMLQRTIGGFLSITSILRTHSSLAMDLAAENGLKAAVSDLQVAVLGVKDLVGRQPAHYRNDGRVQDEDDNAVAPSLRLRRLYLQAWTQVASLFS